MKIKEYIVQNKEKVGIVCLAIAAMGGLFYWLSRKPKQNTPQTPLKVQQNDNPMKSSIASINTNQQEVQQVKDEEDRKFTQIINKIRSIFMRNNDVISPQIITAIIEGQYQLSNKQIKQAILKSRRQRRQKLNDPLQYANIITTHQLQLQQIQQRCLGTILARFNIDKVTWKEASDEWQSKSQSQQNGISEIIGREEQNQLLSLRNPNALPKDMNFIEKALNWKVQNLSKLNPEELGISLGTDEAARYEMIESYVNDLLFKQFGVQPEDMEFSIQKLSKQNKHKVIQFEDQIGKLMDELIYVQEEQGKQGQFY